MREEYAEEYLSKAIAANGLYENTYPMLSALSRPLISKYLVDAAHQFGAHYIAHGCTGKGNDQVRFETSIKALDPSIEILAPVREWDLLTRDEEMDWATKHGVPVPTTKKSPYSIDDNLWGRAIECGVLEDPWSEPPEDIWTLTASPEEAPNYPEYLEIGFEKGLPTSLNGKQMKLLDIILEVGKLAGEHGCGRLDMIENRMVGMKSRECYEVPAASVLIAAHKSLETLCLDRDTMHAKLDMEHAWSKQIYFGLWFSPYKQAMDAFFAQTQEFVTGTVKMKLYKGNCTVVGRKSPYSLYDYGLASYGSEDSFDRNNAKGFIGIHSLPVQVWAASQGIQGSQPNLEEAYTCNNVNVFSQMAADANAVHFNYDYLQSIAC